MNKPIWNLKGLEKLEGERIILRYPTLSDAEAIFKAINTPKIWGNMGLDPNKKVTLAHEKQWIRKLPKQMKENKEIHWVIEDKKTKEFIGCCGFNHNTESRYRLGVVGAWLAEKHWGKGFAKDALEIIIGVGFKKLGFNKINAEVFSYNKRSLGCVKKVGLKPEGISREKYTIGNKKISDHYFGILKREWKK